MGCIGCKVFGNRPAYRVKDVDLKSALVKFSRANDQRRNSLRVTFAQDAKVVGLMKDQDDKEQKDKYPYIQHQAQNNRPLSLCSQTTTDSAFTESSAWSSSGASFDGEISFETQTDTEIHVCHNIRAYEVLLQQIVSVEDVIKHMDFISFSDCCPKDSRSEAFLRLISQIEQCREIGKWQKFMTALDKAGYSYVASLLRGETEKDNNENMQILKIFSHEIIDRISGDLNSFVDIFYEKEVITVQDKEEIQAEKERKGSLAASFMLVDKLPTKISTWYEKLISIAEQFHLDDIAEILDVPEGTTNVNLIKKTLRQGRNARISSPNRINQLKAASTSALYKSSQVLKPRKLKSSSLDRYNGVYENPKKLGKRQAHDELETEVHALRQKMEHLEATLMTYIEAGYKTDPRPRKKI